MHETYGTRDHKYEQQVDNLGVQRYRQSICHQLLCTLINNLNAELNPTCHLLILLGVHRILHVSGIRVNT